MYRAMTLAAIDRGVNPSDSDGLGKLAEHLQITVDLPAPGSDEAAAIRIDGVDVTSELRRHDVEDAVSLVSRVPAVREALVEQQRRIAAGKAIVMAGRDIGTVVLPNADLKLYLDAPIEERAPTSSSPSSTGSTSRAGCLW
jgi:cytidylate kinase